MALVVGQGVSRSPSKPDLTSPRIQLNTFSLAQFVDPLPRLEIAQPIGYRPSPDDPKVQLPYYRVAMGQLEEKVHRDLKPTRFWGYASTSPGPSFEPRSG